MDPTSVRVAPDGPRPMATTGHGLFTTELDLHLGQAAEADPVDLQLCGVCGGGDALRVLRRL
ncbi:MAG: hypothetical protein MUD05_05170 [Candidatus Nanopelagicales bacterium]|nr:hypothetical protein [Candidatus Nanopelagicales bacterium]